jgi:DNA-binding transcriptional LysR family regulator
MPDWNNESIQLRDLRILQIILDEGSLTRAAALLNTTQPTLSKALTRLRAHFNDPLLVRDGQRMRLTAKASHLQGPLRDWLRDADNLRDPGTDRFDPLSSDRMFRLLLSDVGMMRFLPALTAHLAAAGPKLRLQAVPLDSHEFETRLATGEADLALGTYAKAPRNLRRQQLYTDNYLSVVRQDHPNRPRLTRRTPFCAARHIVVTASDTGHSAHQMAQDTIEAAIAPDRVLLRLPSFIAAALVAAETDGIATLPAVVAASMARHLQLATFRTPIAMPPISVAQYWHERYHRDPAHRWLRQACFKLFGNAR